MRAPKRLRHSSPASRRTLDVGRPRHVAAGREAPIPALDDELGLDARFPIRLELGGASLDDEPSCPDAHRASIGAWRTEVDPANAFLRVDCSCSPRTDGPLCIPGVRQICIPGVRQS
jgi:hypothetical protein